MTAKSNKILVTIPADLHDRVKAKAEASRRSLSGYVGYVLDREHPAPSTLEEAIRKRIAAQYEKLSSQIDTSGERPVLFLRDMDGVLMPVPLDAKEQVTVNGETMSLHDLAIRFTFCQYGQAMGNTLERLGIQYPVLQSK